MSEDNKISVIINTYNAEQHLRKVLDSVKDFDEVVVCDMESTDHTLEIAKEYGCKIVTFDFFFFFFLEQMGPCGGCRRDCDT